ncbi:MAG: fasciclin domain-containing protein, partial [Bacteroidia bacterium]
MKKTLLVLIAVFAGLFNLSLQAQCPNNNTLFFTYPAPTTIGASVGTGICIFAGEHYVITNMQAGSTYRLSSCGSPDLVDTRITVYPDASGGSALAFNDDFCGTRAQLDFTPATTGSYRILLDKTGPGNSCISSTTECGEIVVSLISTGAVTDYCTPQYAVGVSNGDFINGVSLGSISNLNTGSSTGSSYNDFTNLSTELLPSTAYQLTVQNNPDFSEIIAAWIDYNQDLTFSTDELLGQTSVAAGQNGVINFTTPASPAAGQTRMRVRMTFTIPVSGGQMDPCVSYQFGEAEDYAVSFPSDPPGPPSGLNFSTACGLSTTIQDNACPNNTTASVTVSGLDASLGTAQQLSSVDVIIEHAQASDLDLFLQAPDGSVIELSTDNGGLGADYGSYAGNVCTQVARFSMSAQTAITSANAPFIGSFIPEGNLNSLNNGINPNGIWRLRACDDFAGDIGTIRFFSVNFEALQTEVPSCADSYNLADAAQNVPVDQQLSWVAGTGQPTGYDVYFGTSQTPILVSDAQSTTSFNPGTLLPSTTYFYQIVPSNNAGDAVGCPIRSFTTSANEDVILMTNGSINTCTGIFTDGGGSNGNYANGDSLVFTIFPDAPNSAVQVDFSTFELEDGFDIFAIADGADENATVIGVYNGTNSPGIVTATNPTGALTFAFLADDIINAPGWTAAISCVPLTSVPSCVASSAPADLASGVSIDSDLTWTEGSGAPTSYDIYFGTNPAPALAQADFQGTTFDVGTLFYNTTYYYQIVPKNASGSATDCPVLQFTTESEPVTGILMQNGTLTVCDGQFFDSGAASNDYSTEESLTLTLLPEVSGNLVSVTFDQFSTEAELDVLTVYSGSTVSGSPIASLSGSDLVLPLTLTSSAADGALTFVFNSDLQVTEAGWSANVSCITVSDSTVWDIVVNSEVHNTLESLVLLAGLDGALDGPGPLTLFAPTDAAFAALPQVVVDALVADPTGALTDVLLYHVVGAQALSSDLTDGQQIVTLNGESVTVTISDGNVLINDALVIVRDILADNGVVHVIDAVLVPPTPEPDTTVWDIVVNSEVHNTLESLVLLAGLDGALDGPGPLTLFAPTDAAFAALPQSVVDALVADPTGALTDVLLYHVVGAQALSTDLTDGQQVVTLNGESVTVTINVDGIFINDAQVIVRDILADNGVVHVIDAVLTPPVPEPDTTVWDIVVNSEVHNTLESLVLLAELDGALDNIDASLTLFAPTDAAFAALNPTLVDALVADPTGALAQVLLYHVVGSQALSTDLSDGQQIVTLNGESVTVSITPDGIFINDAQVIIRDILADNGVVHVLDAVLTPPTPEPDTTVWDIVVNSEVHNTLESLVQLAELDGALDNIDASLTLFAPTDAAFAALDPAVVAALTADPTGALAQVLLYHVVGSQALSADLSDGQQIVTLNGESVTVSIVDGSVFINDAQVIIADILADNGVVHVIDAVLTPPVPEPDTTVWDIVVNSEVHNT